MKALHLFNPENDIALACGCANFTAPKAAVDLHNAGAVLPMWYANNGDSILAYGVNDLWFNSRCETFGIDVDIFDHGATTDFHPSPWGWSAAARRFFEHEDFCTNYLPDDKTIEQWRQLSHRRTAARLQQSIAPELDFEIAPAALEIHTVDELQKHLVSLPDAVLKSPWSSSGRGLIDTRQMKADEILRRAEGIIRKQGSIMFERAYNLIGDFAVLYDCLEGRCKISGFSVFKADKNGAYTGNILAADSYLEHLIDNICPINQVRAAAEAIRAHFEKLIAPYYNGPVGVDMFGALLDGSKVVLNATVEINMRMTMGRVALEFSRRYLTPNSQGYFSITPNNNQTLVNDSFSVEDKRLVSGRMMLTPPGGKFRFVAEAAPCDSAR